MTAPSAVPAAVAPASDLDLIARVRAGDARAMESLMRRHNRILFRTARAILRDDAEAEDAVQDAYIAAYRGLDRFRGESKLSTWLVRIAANEALMRRRRNARSAKVVSIDGSMDGESGDTLMKEETHTPEREALRGQLRGLLEARIDALPDGYRTVFVLRAVEELSVEETAAALDIPEATVRTRFFRARGLLRESLAREIDHTMEEAFGFDGERCDRLVRRVLTALGLPPGSGAGPETGEPPAKA